jgi:hypothetical protein
LTVVAAELAVNLEAATQQFVAAGDRNLGHLETEVLRQTQELQRRGSRPAPPPPAPSWQGPVPSSARPAPGGRLPAGSPASQVGGLQIGPAAAFPPAVAFPVALGQE